MAFVEALAAGLPVVTTRQGAAEEILDAACGVLVSPGQPVALEAALRDLVTDSCAAPQARVARPCPGAAAERSRRAVESAAVGADRDDPGVRARMTISGAAAYQDSKHARARASAPAATRSTGWSPPRSNGTTSRGAARRRGLRHGALHRAVQHRFAEYHGLDAVRYSGFPDAGEFTRVDLDAAQLAGRSRQRPIWSRPSRRSSISRIRGRSSASWRRSPRPAAGWS